MLELSNWLARLTVNQVPYGRGGSSPSSSTIMTLRKPFCRLSSVVEHFHGKEGVSSSSLEGGSSIIISCLYKKRIHNTPCILSTTLSRVFRF